MIERAAVGAASARAGRLGAPAGYAALFVVALLGAAAGAPYLFRVSTLHGEVAEQLRLTLGLSLSDRHARFDLLPRPRVVMKKVAMRTASGRLRLDADELDGDVRLFPLLLGRIELAGMTLRRPNLSIDLSEAEADGGRGVEDAVRTAFAADDTPRRLGSMTFVDGTVTVFGSNDSPLRRIAHVDATLDWRDLGSPATLMGSFTRDGGTGTLAAWVAQPLRLLRGDGSPLTVALHIPSGSFSLNGVIAGRRTPSFRGRIAVALRSLSDMLAAAGHAVALPAPFADLSLASDAATIEIVRGGIGAIDLPDLRLSSDSNSFEGTLAFQSAPAPLLSGTLASDRLDLAPFFAPSVAAAPRPAMPGRAAFGLDLRISATHLRVGRLVINDAALAVITRDDRTELALAEARAYGGSLRGRLSLGGGTDGKPPDLRGSATFEGADTAALSWDLAGRQLISGTATGNLTAETKGTDPADLLAHLDGSAYLRISDGAVSTLDLSRLLRDSRTGSTPTGATPIGSTPFSNLKLGATIEGGNVTLKDASLTSPTLSVALSGTVNLVRRALDLQARTPSAPGTRTAGSGEAPPESPKLSIRGAIWNPVVGRD